MGRGPILILILILTLILILVLILILILILTLRALRYRHRYLRDDAFDNVYITRRFVLMDEQRALQGRPTVLPLTPRESTRYIHPARTLRNVWLWLSTVGDVCNRELGTPFHRCLRLFADAKDRCERALSFLFFLCYIIITFRPLCGFANLGLLFCIIPGYVQAFLRRVVADPPALLAVSVSGSGYTSDIYRDMVSAFDVLQRGNVSVLSQRCVLRPVEPDYGTYISMGILYGVCFFIALCGGQVARLRRVVCAAYYPSREQ
ncbi:UNVERIFIED_CONTAM: hypothetical protein H355_011969, partial [Colinus virginianus]